MNWDEQVFLAINRESSGDLATVFFGLVTRLGDGGVLALIILPALWFFDRERFRRHALLLVVSVALSGALVNLMKLACDRSRPLEHFEGDGVAVHVPYGSPSDRSFPSGHTQTAFGAAVYLSCMYPPWSPVFVGAAALVGLSRIAIGVHFPADVLVGCLIGAAFSLAGYYFARRRASPG